MDMWLETLLEWDRNWFIYVQEHWTSSIGDTIWPYVRNKYSWIGLYVFFIAVAIWKYKKHAVWIIAGALLTVVLADQFSAGLIKPLAERIRPCNQEDLQYLFRNLVDCGSGYSFISAHACNHFALAIYFSWVFNQWRASNWWMPVFTIWAAAISFGQVYVGVHFPLDVIAGGIAGICIGWLVLKALQWVLSKVLN